LFKCQGLCEFKSKEAKENEKEKGKSVLDCRASDGPMPPTGQSGMHRTVRCTVWPAAYSREFLATSTVIQRTVRSERQTVRCASRQQLAATSAEAQQSSGAPYSPVPPPDGLVPPRTGNQPITRFSAPHTVHCPMCTGQSGAPAERRHPKPTKWSSNGS
jgi:hypothetical protein